MRNLLHRNLKRNGGEQAIAKLSRGTCTLKELIPLKIEER